MPRLLSDCRLHPSACCATQTSPRPAWPRPRARAPAFSWPLPAGLERLHFEFRPAHHTGRHRHPRCTIHGPPQLLPHQEGPRLLLHRWGPHSRVSGKAAVKAASKRAQRLMHLACQEGGGVFESPWPTVEHTRAPTICPLARPHCCPSTCSAAQLKPGCRWRRLTSPLSRRAWR